MTATNQTPDNEAARDEHRWTHGAIIDAGAAAYAEDARRSGDLPGWPFGPEQAAPVLDTHSVAATSDRYWSQGCGADVLSRDEGPAGRWSRGAVLAQESARSIADRAAAPVEDQHAADMATVRGWDGAPEGVGGFRAALRRLSDDAVRARVDADVAAFTASLDPAPVEVEAALPGEWVVIATLRTDTTIPVPLPGRHTVDAALDQARTLLTGGMVQAVEVRRA